MTPEGEFKRVKSVHIDMLFGDTASLPTELSIVGIAHDQTAIHIRVSASGILFQTSDAPLNGVPIEPVNEIQATPEQEKPQQFSGKLKSEPQEGLKDKKGNPTATAMFVVHEEGSTDGKPYYAVFYQQTRDIALKLRPDDPITVVGFPIATQEEGKRDTLRVKPRQRSGYAGVP